MNSLQTWAPDGVGEVHPGDDLAELLVNALATKDHPHLVQGDIVCVTSKVVSKAENRVVSGERDEAINAEMSTGTRLVAQRGPTRIVRTRHGLTMAAAGIDASNVTPGHLVLLPLDPDRSARLIRVRVAEITGCNVGVIVTDTAGRAWREGQTDLAIGACGLRVLDSHAGREDRYGNALAVTAPAVADEIAGAAQLVQSKLAGRPFAIVRGLADFVLPPGENGPGARALVRAEAADLFGYGTRQAVIEALAGRPEARGPFGAPASTEELRSAITYIWPQATVCSAEADQVTGPTALSVEGAPHSGLQSLAFAHGWRLIDAEPSADRQHRIGLCPAST